jgi:hypothetical protein
MLLMLSTPGKPPYAGMLLSPSMLPNPRMLPLASRGCRTPGSCHSRVGRSVGRYAAESSVILMFCTSTATARMSRAVTNTLADLVIVAAATSPEPGLPARNGSEEEKKSDERLYDKNVRGPQPCWPPVTTVTASSYYSRTA